MADLSTYIYSEEDVRTFDKDAIVCWACAICGQRFAWTRKRPQAGTFKPEGWVLVYGPYTLVPDNDKGSLLSFCSKDCVRTYHLIRHMNNIASRAEVLNDVFLEIQALTKAVQAGIPPAPREKF